MLCQQLPNHHYTWSSIQIVQLHPAGRNLVPICECHNHGIKADFLCALLFRMSTSLRPYIMFTVAKLYSSILLVCCNNFSFSFSNSPTMFSSLSYENKSHHSLVFSWYPSYKLLVPHTPSNPVFTWWPNSASFLTQCQNNQMSSQLLLVRHRNSQNNE
jgi:hypothetical protein